MEIALVRTDRKEPPRLAAEVAAVAELEAKRFAREEQDNAITAPDAYLSATLVCKAAAQRAAERRCKCVARL
jgi:hypothetical protein